MKNNNWKRMKQENKGKIASSNMIFPIFFAAFCFRNAFAKEKEK
jgi:hypothetical protein